MIGTIRKHSTWLWLIIIAATIVSFVIFFTPSAMRGGGGGRGPESYGTMNGQPIPVKRYRTAALEAQLGFFMQSQGRYFPQDVNAAQFGFDLDRETRSRLVLLAQLDALGIEVDDASVADWIRRRFASPDQPGAARAVYEQMLAALTKRGISTEQFSDYIRHEIGVEHMVRVVGVAGELVTPREATDDFRERNELMEAQAVILEATNFLAQVQITPEALGEFYTNRLSAYRTPERVQVDYVRFAASNYIARAEEALGRITNLTERLDALYQQRGASTFLDTNGQVMPPDAAKLKLREEQRDREALLVARREAAKFGTELMNLEPAAATNLWTVAAAQGIPVETSVPFNENGMVPIPGAGQDLGQVAFKLDGSRPISAPLVGQQAVFIIALKQRIPSEVPSLDAVRLRVTEDFRRDESRKLVRAAGTNLVATLKAVVNSTNDFASAVIASGNALTSLPKFSEASRNVTGWPRQIPLSTALTTVKDMAVGDISDYVDTGASGFILHLQGREPVGETELKDALPEHLADMQTSGRFAAFREWLTHRIDQSRLSFPGDSTGAENPAAEGQAGAP
ncbi:MAG: SurA N-terminal domain-containing protein [Verrucomicrobiales bacterium]|nr:SurA N-terminal domain-containing protein [Verrucomicrobiales bacterium]